MLKTTQIYLLLFLISFQSWGIFLAYPLAESTAKIKYWISEKNMEERQFTAKDFAGLHWHNKKEIILEGNFYDVEKIAKNEKGYLVKMMLDNYESKLMKRALKFTFFLFHLLESSIELLMSSVLCEHKLPELHFGASPPVFAKVLNGKLIKNPEKTYLFLHYPPPKG